MNLLSGAEYRILAAGDALTGHAVYFHLFDRELAGISVLSYGKTKLSDSVRWLHRKIALVPSPLFRRRKIPKDSSTRLSPKKLSEQSGRDACHAVLKKNIHLLAVSIIQAYGVQLVLGAPFLNNDCELAKKHCEGELPGRALYLFDSPRTCREFVRSQSSACILK